LDAASLRVPRDAQPAARLLLTQQIERAITAAERRDEATFRDALAAAAALADALFDPADSGVQAVIVELDTLSQQGLAWQLPSLGASLTELRALRGARQVLQSNLSPPTATKAEAGVASPEVRTPAHPQRLLPNSRLKRKCLPEVSNEGLAMGIAQLAADPAGRLGLARAVA
jgi:hypothetical protein